MMVGILFIFLLLLTVFALSYREAEREQKVKLAEYLAAQEQAKAAQHRARESEMRAEKEAAIAAASKAENDRFRSLLFQAVAQLEKDIKDREAARGLLLASLKQSLGNKGIPVSVDP